MSAGPTVRGCLAEISDRLRGAGIEEARREARILVGHGLGIGPTALLAASERRLGEAEAARIDRLVARRDRREPIAYILEEREFWSLPFRLNRDVLVPRPDSEAVVEAVLESVAERGPRLRLLDLGTGSGCLLLALLSELPRATGVGVDISPAAVAVALANARHLGLAGRTRFLCADWGRALAGRFDVVVANPPYVPEATLDRLAPEIARHEPRAALASGADGLECLRSLAPDAARLLAPGGFAAVEIGAGQTTKATAILARHGLRVTDRRRDLAGRIRCLVLAAAKTKEFR